DDMPGGLGAACRGYSRPVVGVPLLEGVVEHCHTGLTSGATLHGVVVHGFLVDQGQVRRVSVDDQVHQVTGTGFDSGPDAAGTTVVSSLGEKLFLGGPGRGDHLRLQLVPVAGGGVDSRVRCRAQLFDLGRPLPLVLVAGERVVNPV